VDWTGKRGLEREKVRHTSLTTKEARIRRWKKSEWIIEQLRNDSLNDANWGGTKKFIQTGIFCWKRARGGGGGEGDCPSGDKGVESGRLRKTGEIRRKKNEKNYTVVGNFQSIATKGRKRGGPFILISLS